MLIHLVCLLNRFKLKFKYSVSTKQILESDSVGLYIVYGFVISVGIVGVYRFAPVWMYLDVCPVTVLVMCVSAPHFPSSLHNFWYNFTLHVTDSILWDWITLGNQTFVLKLNLNGTHIWLGVFSVLHVFLIQCNTAVQQWYFCSQGQSYTVGSNMLYCWCTEYPWIQLCIPCNFHKPTKIVFYHISRGGVTHN